MSDMKGSLSALKETLRNLAHSTGICSPERHIEFNRDQGFLRRWGSDAIAIADLGSGRIVIEEFKSLRRFKVYFVCGVTKAAECNHIVYVPEDSVDMPQKWQVEHYIALSVPCLRRKLYEVPDKDSPKGKLASLGVLLFDAFNLAVRIPQVTQEEVVARIAQTFKTPSRDLMNLKGAGPQTPFVFSRHDGCR